MNFEEKMKTPFINYTIIPIDEKDKEDNKDAFWLSKLTPLQRDHFIERIQNLKQINYLLEEENNELKRDLKKKNSIARADRREKRRERRATYRTPNYI